MLSANNLRALGSLPIMNKLNSSTSKTNNNTSNNSSNSNATPAPRIQRQRRTGLRLDEAPQLTGLTPSNSSNNLTGTSTSSRVTFPVNNSPPTSTLNTTANPTTLNNNGSKRNSSGGNMLNSILGSILGNISLADEENLDEEDVDNIIRQFKPLLDLLLYNEPCRLYFILSFASISNVTTRENILTSMLQLLNEQSQNASHLLLTFIDFDANRPEHVKKLNFESKVLDANDTPSQRLLKLFNRLYGNDYLEAVFDGIVDELNKQEDDSTEMASHVLQLTEKLIYNVQMSIDKVPNYLRNICVHIAKQGPTEQASLYNVASIVFRNFVCPAIILPEKFNIWNSEIPPTSPQRQLLVAASKIFLQLLPPLTNAKSAKLSTTVLDNDSDFSMHTGRATKFLDHHRPLIRDFCLQVSNPENLKIGLTHSNTIPLRYSIPELFQLHKYLSEHYTLFPVLEPIERFSESSHIRKVQEVTNLLKSAKSRDQYIQSAQKVGRLSVPISWVKNVQRPNEELHTVTKDYDFLSERQLLKDLERDSILINNKLFKNCSDLWEVVSYMIQCFGAVKMTELAKAQAAISILQKTGRTSGGGDSFDATFVVFGSNEAAIVTPDSFSMNDHPHTIQITREGNPIESVKIETSQVNYYKITDAKTYHEEHSIWFKVKSTVKWNFVLSLVSDNVVDVGKVILEPEVSMVEPEFKLLAHSPVDQYNVPKPDTYLKQLQRALYQVEVKERERIRNSQFKGFYGARLKK